MLLLMSISFIFSLSQHCVTTKKKIIIYPKPTTEPLGKIYYQQQQKKEIYSPQSVNPSSLIV